MPILDVSVFSFIILLYAVSSLPVGKAPTRKKSPSPKGHIDPRDKLKYYCKATGKGNPTFNSERMKGSRKFEGKAYIPKTCGWISGDPKITKAEAEIDAAAKLVAKLNIP